MQETNLVVWSSLVGGGVALLVLEPAQDVNCAILVEYTATYNGLDAWVST